MMMVLPETEIQFDITRPRGTETLYHARATHIPTGTVIKGTGPSLYRVKRDLTDRLTAEVFNRG